MSFVSAVIAAGGTGSRLGANIPKQFLRLDEKSVIHHAVKPFSDSPYIDEIVVVTLPEYIDFCKKELGAFTKLSRVINGGKTRQQSVLNGLNSLNPQCTLVVVHDAARPFVTKEDIARTIKAADNCAAVVGTSLKDTVKQADTNGYVKHTPDRASLRAVQTPQAIPYNIFMEAYKKAEKEGFMATDDVSLAEFLGYPVRIVEGSENNIKITSQIDLYLAKMLFNSK